MSQSLRWDRREFLATVAAAGLSMTVGESLGLQPVREASRQHATTQLVFAGCRSQDGSEVGSIECFRVEGNRWTQLGAVASPNPRALALHPFLPVLYVAHGVSEHLGLPRGSVSAYRIDLASGTLTPWSLQPLSLSAVRPAHLAVSPDGSSLMVCSPAGGAYNLMSLTADGKLRRTPYALKQTGSGPHPLQATAQPRAAVFHPAGQAIYACDFGADRLDHLTLNEGTPAVVSHHLLAPGSGPAYLAMHPSRNRLLVSSELRPALTVFLLDGETDAPCAPMRAALDAWRGGPVVVSPHGDRAYVVMHDGPNESSVAVYAISDIPLRLRSITTTRSTRIGRIEEAALAGDRLVVAGTGGIATLPIDGNGVLGEASVVVRAMAVTSLTIAQPTV